jgi:hypothetical protein
LTLRVCFGLDFHFGSKQQQSKQQRARFVLILIWEKLFRVVVNDQNKEQSECNKWFGRVKNFVSSSAIRTTTARICLALTFSFESSLRRSKQQQTFVGLLRVCKTFVLALTFSQQVVIASIRNNKVCFDFDFEDGKVLTLERSSDFGKFGLQLRVVNNNNNNDNNESC